MKKPVPKKTNENRIVIFKLINQSKSNNIKPCSLKKAIQISLIQLF